MDHISSVRWGRTDRPASEWSEAKQAGAYDRCASHRTDRSIKSMSWWWAVAVDDDRWRGISSARVDGSTCWSGPCRWIDLDDADRGSRGPAGGTYVVHCYYCAKGRGPIHTHTHTHNAHPDELLLADQARDKPCRLWWCCWYNRTIPTVPPATSERWKFSARFTYCYFCLSAGCKLQVCVVFSLYI